MGHDMAPAGPYGGYVSYTPRVQLSEGQLLELRDALTERTYIEEPENGDITLDWFCNPVDGPPYHTREAVAVYVDGGDSEQPALLLYRTGGNPNHRPAAIHVPAADRQAELADVALGLWRTHEGTVTGLALLEAYLRSVINNDGAWEPFEFTGEYE